VAALPRSDSDFLELVAHAWNPTDDRAWRWCCEHLRARAVQLMGTDTSPLVASLAAVAAACWVELEQRLIAVRPDRVEESAAVNKTLDRALHRWTVAAKTLAVVRKMQPRMIQVNIAAAQQVVNQR
jgi:hypothetical protein